MPSEFSKVISIAPRLLLLIKSFADAAGVYCNLALVASSIRERPPPVPMETLPWLSNTVDVYVLR